MSSNGLIEGNRFERIRSSAIDIGNEYPHWAEAGWAENIVIKNNTFKDVGVGEVFSTHNKVPAAICLFVKQCQQFARLKPR